MQPDPDASGPIAIRGEDHVLGRIVSIDDAGNQVDRLVRFSLGASRLITQIVVFDVDDVDAAIDELDDAYVESLSPAGAMRLEHERRLGEAMAGGDLSALAEYLGDDMVVHDHQVMGMGATFGREQLLELVAARPSTIGIATLRTLNHVFISAGVTLSLAELRSVSPEHGAHATKRCGTCSNGAPTERYAATTSTTSTLRIARLPRPGRWPPITADRSTARLERLTAPRAPPAARRAPDPRPDVSADHSRTRKGLAFGVAPSERTSGNSCAAPWQTWSSCGQSGKRRVMCGTSTTWTGFSHPVEVQAWRVSQLG